LATPAIADNNTSTDNPAQKIGEAFGRMALAMQPVEFVFDKSEQIIDPNKPKLPIDKIFDKELSASPLGECDPTPEQPYNLILRKIDENRTGMTLQANGVNLPIVSLNGISFKTVKDIPEEEQIKLICETDRHNTYKIKILTE